MCKPDTIYRSSKRSNYFVRMDHHNKKMILERLVSIAETWGGSENNFGLAACCDPDHFPETAGNIYFEYRPDSKDGSFIGGNPPSQLETETTPSGDIAEHTDGCGNVEWTAPKKIVLRALHRRNQSPSQIMEELLSQHLLPPSKQMALFARIRLATYFAIPEQRHKCIRARLQALSILSYTFDVDERHLYPSLLDELVEVLELPDGQYTGIKACALRTMTAIVNSHRLGITWTSLVSCTGLSSYHGILPSLTRRWIQGLVDGTIEAPGGSTNQQFTTAILSFLYHLACYEENVGPGNTQNATLSSSGVLDTMLQLIAWHTSRNDCLSYVTRAVRVTDQILMSIATSRLNVVNILVNRLSFEVDLVLKASSDGKIRQDLGPALNTQRSGLMKSILNLLKRLCLDTDWGEVMHTVMEDTLPDILRQVFLNGSIHFTPHLALFAMETITNYLYTYPSRISSMQDKNVTTDILTALTSQPLPQNRDFLVQLPGLFNTLALNARGIEAIQSSGVLSKYLETLVSPDYLPTMKTKRVRDFLSQISYNLSSSTGQTLSNSLTASQMSNAIQELLRSRSELKTPVFQGLVACMKRVVEIGRMQPASLVVEPIRCVSDTHTLGTDDNTKLTNEPPDSTVCEHLGSDLPCLTGVALGRSIDTSQAATSTSGGRGIGEPDGMLEEDVVMLSGDEDEDGDDDHDIDDVSRATQTAAHQHRSVNTRLMDSRSTSPTASLNLKEDLAPTSRPITSLADGSPVPAYHFLSDFMLNTCKFLEKLLPSVLHVTEAMCRHFMSHGGLQVLCDLLRMPGLPYDFPVSASCASLCKIFEDLANSIYLNDVIAPLFQCLESSLEKLAPLQNSQFTLTSLLLREYMANEHVLLHELVVTASIICIMVQIIDHLKSELRPSLADKWLVRNVLHSLGRLYLGVSWEACILLKILYGDKDITEADINPQERMDTSVHPPATCTADRNQASDESGWKPEDDTTGQWRPVTETSPMPQFVEALHIYSILRPSKIPTSGDNKNAFLHQRPELAKATHRILHVTAFLINSVTELCTSWSRFFANRNQLNYRRRRMTLLPSEQIPTARKYAALSEISQVISGALAWEPAVTTTHHPAAPTLICAMRYSSIRLTNVLLHDASQKGPQGGMMNVFFMLNGIRRYFGLFKELVKFDLTDPKVRTSLTETLEEWLVCADRMSSTEYINTELARSSDNDITMVDPERYIKEVHRCMLFPLNQLCIRKDLQNLLTRRAVEHLLSMLVTIVPYLFKATSKPSSPGPACSIPQVLSTVIHPDTSTSVPPVTTLSTEDAIMDVSESGTAEPELDGRTRVNIRLLEEMGFSREVAVVALEQTEGDVNEAVNILVSTPAEELLATTATVRSSRSATLQRRDTVEQPTQEGSDSSVTRSASAIAAAAMELASVASSLLSSAESPLNHLNATTGERSRSSTQQPIPSLPSSLKIPFDWQKPLAELESLAPEKIEELRESLKRHVFRACYSIAKHHHSDQILHRIAELLLSSGEEEHYIDELFGFVAATMSGRLGLSAASPTIPSLSVNVDEAGVSVQEQPTVGLHLSALLFSRCQSLCARLAWKHNLPHLLITWVARCEQSSDCPPDTAQQANHGLDTDYYKTLLLSCLILDLYERSIQAMQLRQISSKLYLNSHTWNWFDDRAMLWHPYASESGRIIDTAFHNGELSAYCHISRRPYAVEFPTMTQINLDSMHRRPVLLMPSTAEDTDERSNKESAYERSILDAEIPPKLTGKQRRTLFTGLVHQFERATTHSAISQTTVPLCDTSCPTNVHASSVLFPSDCVNAMLRLLLRLAYSSFDDAREMIDVNLLSVLLSFPHSRDFTAEYSAFVGSIVIQMFEDRPTVNRTMKEVIRKMCKFGLPSSFMGVRINSPACRDLFYLLSMCAPIMAKDRETALKIACDTINLSISDADVTAKTVPKDYIVEAPLESDDKDQDTFPLSDRQQAIITQLIEVIMQPSKTADNRTSQSAIVDTSQRTQSSTSDGIQTSASTLLTSNSTVSDATWSSNLNLAGLPSQNESQSTATVQPSASLPPNATTGSSCPTTGVTVLGKADAIRYLIDLIASYRPVAEFVATYKHKPCGTNGTQFPSLLTYLFSTQLSNPETTDLTTYLLENLVLVGCESTQDIIIAEYKASLGRISSSVPVSGDQGIAYESVQFHKNERVTAHMAFLERLLALPSPLVDRLIGLIYRRHLPADIAKLIALIDCNLPNTQSTLSTTLRTLESLTWVDRQINKLLNSSHERQADQALPGSAVQEAQEGQVVDASQRPEHPTTLTASTEGHSRLAAGGVREAHISSHVNSTRHAPEGVERSSGVHQFDSNSEDDEDEDDHNDNLVHRSTYRVESAVASGQTSTSSALNIVLDNVLMTDSGLVINQPRVAERDVPQPWHTGEQDGSVIFVRDDEDEGSAGQGGEDDNSQDEDGLDVDDGGDDDEEVEDEDNDEDEEDGDEDDDEDDDDDGAGETDEDVIADDGEVALVLRSGSSGRHLRGSRRPRTETISLSVTTSRAGGEPEPTASAGEAVRANFQRGADELNIHGDTHEEDDGSFDDDDVDTFGRDDEDGDDIEMPGPDSEGPVFLSTDSRMLRENDSVVAVVEEVLNLVDLPHQTTSTVVSRGAGGRRDRFIFTPSEFGGLNIIPSRNSGGNWGLFLPRFGGAMNADNHVRNASAGTGLPPNTTIFRFGIGNGGNTSVFVTGSNQSRLNSSGVSITSPANASATPAAQQSIVPLTLPSQHPILQVPSFAMANQSGAVGAGPNTNVRINGSVVTNAAPTPFTNRVTSVLPPIPPVSNTVSSTQYGYRLRIPTGVPPPTVGNDSLRNRAPPARAHTPFITESVGYRPYTTNVPTASTSAVTSSLIARPQSAAVSEAVRDARAGPEADALVWNVLSSVAVDQPLAVNSALASAVFRTDEPTATRTSGGLSSTQLSPYAGYALPASYRRWVTLSRLLFGHELMDLVLISRYQVHQELSRRRQDTLKRRILEAERLANQQQAIPAATPNQPEVAPSAVTSTATVESQQPEVYGARAQMETSHLPTPPISHQPLVEHTLQYSQPDEGTAASQMDTAPGISEEPVQATTTTSTGGSGQPTQSQPTPPPVPMTDEETIQSLVESGMDPSFLDALPEEMRREVIADHRHARQVQQQLRSITLPEHINSDWLAGLPPHIQEEVLLQFRNEQQQNAAAAASGANTTTTSGPAEGAASTVGESGSIVRVPESNTAFLVSLPPSLRREVLADMEESQLEMLPPDLVAEARQLRRESEERFARAVQGGMLAHSFTSRHDRLIGGPGRWDVRFSSINHFLRHLNSLAGPFPPNASVGLHNLPGIRGRHLVDYEGLTCLLALLVASSSCAQQRRQLIPTVKKKLIVSLRNAELDRWYIALHLWWAFRKLFKGKATVAIDSFTYRIGCTLLCIFGGLSENCSKEKPQLQSTPSLTLEPQSSISVAQRDSEVKSLRQSKPSVSNNIFHTGFEAALGCWVRVFHPVSQPIQSFPPETEEGQSKASQESDIGESLAFYCEPTAGTSATPTRNHMIHPQAAAAVSNVLLDTLGDLAKAFPAHFYPRLSGDQKPGPESSELLVTPHKIDWPRPPFWEIFDRLSESAPVLGSVSSSPAHPRSARRPTHGSARKRHGSTSHKQQTSAAPRPTPMDVSLHGSKTHLQDQLPDTGIRAEVDEPTGPCRKRLTSLWASVDYFSQMADLLCHPLLQNRPSNQERVLTILAGILKEFIVNRGRMEEQSATTGQTAETVATPSQPSSKTHLQDQLPDTGIRAEVDEPTGPCRKRLTSLWASVDYFSQMADLLCHPLLQNRPSNQERVLTILAGILKEFIVNRGRMEEQSATTGQTAETVATPSQPSEQLEQPIPPEAVVGQPESSATGVQEPTKATSTSVPPDFVGSIRPEALKTLCEFVCSPKSTESGRSMAAQLITDLAHTNRDMKELMLSLLAESLNALTRKLSIQLQEFSDELTSQLKSDTVISLKQKERTMKPSSSISRLVSMDVLPDRFSSSGQTVVVSGGDSRPNPATAFCDLQLKSIQAFTCPNNEQSRLRGIVGLMVRLTAGECSLNANGSVSVSNQDPFASITSLSEFWPKLSSVFEKLQKCPDMNAVLLLQPLLEAFCLAHLHLVKDSIMIRQRSATSRANRPTITVTAPGAHSLVDMIPMLQVRVDSSTPAPERDEVREPSINENTTHLQLDVMGPMSPPTLSTEDEKAFSDDAARCRRSSSNSATANAVLQFAEQHRIGLNQVLRQHGGSLGESPFAVFLAYPRVLDFDIKRRFFRQQLQALSHRSPLSNRYDDEPILISRDRLFEDSYARLHRKSPAEWKHKFVIRFHNEEGQDAGGPLREWYLLMSREIFNPNYCLFRTSPADRVTYTINPSSYINSNHLSYFKFVGRFIAKAIYDSKLLECYFSRAFYKHILGVPVKCSDLESEDYDFYKGLEFLLKNHVSDLGYELTFSTEINEFGKTETRDLIENGRNVPVTEQNKKEYVRLVCQERMTGAIRQQLDAFLAGFYEIIPKRMISIFNEQELELLISGLPNIDIGDLKANTTYSKYHPNSPQIEWFWCALESFDQEDRARFLQFVTGTSKVPLGGFANLEGMHGPTKFQISRASVSSTNHLPCAHTCFNTLVLPAYETYEQLRARLLTAIRECSEGYGMA
ncbi:hypothetical protein T265_01385 [Opisthorchis viverrini]|uniref:HECT-type E3 ubiquitin transferase n=1 Tax=Opisthorchis viverrini TaxID=6198 RepID=A0A075A9S0_OPIVI|nr:hypothetical protein T265_01385 [Opisthorchis viverrini]KER32505.1 hypothetical protein T265_01385 [Opisthorchis viverrini]